MARPTPVAAPVGSAPVAVDVQGAIAWLKRHGSKAGRDGMARYALPSNRAFGVAMRDVQTLAKQLGPSHRLAEGLWNAWAGRKDEYVKRAAFALLWGLTVHDKAAGDEPFLQGLALVERAATDERHYVKKAVNMALRAVGKRNATLNAAAVATARRLAESASASAQWVGKDAVRELTSASVARRLAAKHRRPGPRRQR